MAEIILKPCPFCGAHAHVYLSSYPNGEKAYRVCCLHYNGCYLDDCIDADFETKEEAEKAWNWRFL